MRVEALGIGSWLGLGMLWPAPAAIPSRRQSLRFDVKQHVAHTGATEAMGSHSAQGERDIQARGAGNKALTNKQSDHSSKQGVHVFSQLSKPQARLLTTQTDAAKKRQAMDVQQKTPRDTHS